MGACHSSRVEVKGQLSGVGPVFLPRGIQSESQFNRLGSKFLDLLSHHTSPITALLKRTSGFSFGVFSDSHHSSALAFRTLLLWGAAESVTFGVGDKGKVGDDTGEMALGPRL